MHAAVSRYVTIAKALPQLSRFIGSQYTALDFHRRVFSLNFTKHECQRECERSPADAAVRRIAPTSDAAAGQDPAGFRRLERPTARSVRRAQVGPAENLVAEGRQQEAEEAELSGTRRDRRQKVVLVPGYLYVPVFNQFLTSHADQQLYRDCSGSTAAEAEALAVRRAFEALSANETSAQSAVPADSKPNAHANGQQDKVRPPNGNATVQTGAATANEVEVRLPRTQPLALVEERSNEAMNGHQLPRPAEDVITQGRPIPDAPLPRIIPNPINNDDYFDVTVVNPATPANFYVQSYNSRLPNSPYTKMAKEMQEFYNNEENKFDIIADLIKGGSVWAAKYNNCETLAR